MKVIKDLLLRITFLVWVGITLMAASYFPVHYVYDLFWKHYSMEEVEAREKYKDYAGLPAGEDIPELLNIEQFDDNSIHKYYTFKTDSIIPVDMYQLKSRSDLYTMQARSRRGRVISSSHQRPIYLRSTPSSRSVYNRYYLVKLPDGNYVMAYLDDGYYFRYLIEGSVQLPMGYKQIMTSEEKTHLRSYRDEYHSESDMLLYMFNVERYDNWKGTSYVVRFLVGAIVMSVYVIVFVIVEQSGKRIAKWFEKRRRK